MEETRRNLGGMEEMQKKLDTLDELKAMVAALSNSHVAEISSRSDANSTLTY